MVLHIIIAMTDINNTTVVLPDYIRIIERKHKGWLFKAMKPFSTYLKVDINDFELLYGINKQQILIESQSFKWRQTWFLHC
ncbi:hypothetical protein NIES4071_16340 [Calothrix sp. NIES-4071]|nr:hypothetical protein NIES4071_16340 [Calothrix sp. NIES-4071]BAZ55968.1 hypothetical protein NIES4105_16290 [Calothrix sp. NIES-4105]